ncbi:hypothetical protein ACRS6Y_02315 [Bacillus cytotoxicus]|uniref:Uncharacterized protein n=1 Tax=Bacillus cytotoxicus (strain DSM 22905 / CIP 110041 / 391-98 / NVH 391-98) TaxID=315749 RepID=A7GMS1_BACCN|nr:MULTISPECIES: hypothetical protein [Bacillus cereus group]ABS21429.1 conserved hypothetical protein [Bacillus cytotoxicus NVH 391-98]AWC32106.1 hypothetical protein CG482_006525 [Bacillus cytotoxicus]AWC36134.1 hypothetical protein CG481_006540 [Bacillus cytotoxicus]AWC44138.1 hypothetical protein CG479_006200 [Bacillus cytotoxicus]AWC60383.1 hypothetical protein CG474_006600 [Bacillus cytotoxicus]
MKQQNAHPSKRVVPTKKEYAGNSIHEQKQMERGNLHIAQKEIGQQNENL